MTHGTDAGYQSHYKKGGDRKPCQPCREAHAARYRAFRHERGYNAPAVDKQSRTEDLFFMAEAGETLNGAAARLGINRDSLVKWMTIYCPAVLERFRDLERRARYDRTAC